MEIIKIGEGYERVRNHTKPTLCSTAPLLPGQEWTSNNEGRVKAIHVKEAIYSSAKVIIFSDSRGTG